MQTMKLKDKIINFKIIKKKKKNINIKVEKNGEILLTVPYKISDNEIEEILKSKSKWIIKHIKFFEGINHKLKPKEYIENEKFLFLGSTLFLNLIKSNKNEVEINNENIIMYYKENILQDQIKKRIEKKYRDNAIEVISNRIEILSKKIDIYPKEIRIRKLKSTWGICSSRGRITINYKLIMAPIEIIDYVILHELSHLKHFNHSKEFWKFIEKYMYNYKEKKKWLKENSYFLFH